MWWQTVQSTMNRAALRVLAKVMIAAILLVFTIMGGAAEACSNNKQAASSAVAHKIERVSSVPTVIVSATPESSAVKLIQDGLCCGAGCHTHGAACGSGCCAADFASAGLVYSSLFSPLNSAGLSPLDQAKAVSAQLPPDFRPPRILI